MELQNAPTEEQLFYNIPTTREPKPGNYPLDPTYAPNQEVSGLNSGAGKPIGHAKVLSVLEGDKINIDTKYFFDGNPFVPSTLRPITDILTQLANIFFLNPASTVAGVGEASNQAWANETFINNPDISQFLTAAFDNADQNNSDKPRAFLVYLFFNKDFKFNPISSGLLQASTPDQLGDLAVLDLKVPENGYLYVYVSNETDKNVEFDNLQIDHQSNCLIETNDYYPYGLLLPRSTALDVSPQDYKYNGKELQRDLQFNVEDYGARQYDPVIGRFTGIDAYTEKYYPLSGYQYAACNPILYIDINGDSLMLFKNGKYISTVDNGKKAMTGFNQESKLDKNGKETFTGGQSFDFNDINSDKEIIQDLKNGQESLDIINNEAIDHLTSNVNDQNVFSRWMYAYSESQASHEMDYSPKSSFSKSSLNIINGSAYNYKDAGNYAWGYAMGKMGFAQITAKLAAHLHAWNSGVTDNGSGSQNSNALIRWFENKTWGGDSEADQRAIIKGMNAAGKYSRNKINSIYKIIKN